MIDVKNVRTFGWGEALHGMRNSYNSWEKQDSKMTYLSSGLFYLNIGPEDLALCKKLAKAGGSHAKFRRMITIYCDITAPLYWWKEFDTYKVGTVANSSSTMHTIMEKPFDIWSFSTENLLMLSVEHMSQLIDILNIWRDKYLAETDEELKKKYWWQIIQLLPTSYNQKRTVMLNYEVAAHMYAERKNHKLKEWRTFCEEFIEKLPYADELITMKEGSDE